MEQLKKYAILIICIFNVLLHLTSILYLEYHRDELLYFSLSNHLEFGYASVPPFISWMAYLMKSIFGFSMIAVKLLPALLSGAFVYLGARIVKELGGDLFAQIICALALIFCPLGLRAFILFQPVPFDVFFWTLTYFVILKYMNTDNDKWLLFLGLVVGLALLNKYLILLQLFSLFILLPFTKYRSLFSNRNFYLGLLITLVMVSPNIYWQYDNGFPLFVHLSGLQENQLQYVSKSTFLIEQVLLYFSGFLVAVMGIVYLFREKRSKQLWIFPSSALIVILSLLFMSGKAYYTAGVYPFLIAAGCVFLASKIKKHSLRIATASFIVIMVIPILPFGIPFLPPKKLSSYFDTLDSLGMDLGRNHEDGQKHLLPQDFADMLGWTDIAKLAKQAYDSVEDQKACAIYGENYGIAGAVSLLNEKFGMPEALSFSDAYRYWVPEKFDPDITSLIYINDELGSDIQQLFSDIKVVGKIDDPYSRQYGVTVYLCQKPNRSFNLFWKDTLDRVFENN